MRVVASVFALHRWVALVTILHFAAEVMAQTSAFSESNKPSADISVSAASSAISSMINTLPATSAVSTVAVSAGPYSSGESSTNVTFAANAPQFIYTSPGQSKPNDGWNLTFSLSPPVPWSNTSVGQGHAQMTSSIPQANMTFSYVGTRVIVSGSLNGSAVLNVGNGYSSSYQRDGLVQSAVLFDTGDTQGASLIQPVSVILLNGSITIESIQLTTIVGGTGARVTTQTLVPTDVNNDPFFDNIGDWTTISQTCGDFGNGSRSGDCGPYLAWETSTINARIVFYPPTNTSFLTMYGTLGPGYGPFMVEPSIPQPYFYDNVSFPTASPWLQMDVPMYFMTLDPRLSWTINIDFLGSDSEYFDLTRIVCLITIGGSTDYYNPVNRPYNYGSNNAGQIAGIVIGCVAFLVLCGVGFWWWRRRRRHRREAELSEKGQSGRKRTVGQEVKGEGSSSPASIFEIDGDTESSADLGTTVTPLPLPSGSTTYERQTRSTPLSPTGQRSDHSEMKQNDTVPPLKLALMQQGPLTQGPSLSRDASSPRLSEEPPRLPPLKLALMTGPPLGPSSAVDNSPQSMTSTHVGTPTTSMSTTSLIGTLKSARSQSQLRPQQQHVVTEEQDAGPVPNPQPEPEVIEELIPPRYNPAWADQFTAGAAVTRVEETEGAAAVDATSVETAPAPDVTTASSPSNMPHESPSELANESPSGDSQPLL